MIKRHGKKIVSVLLTLFVVFSYLGFMPKEVDAASVIGTSVKANTVYSTTSLSYKISPSGYYYITKFTPSETGYYMTESSIALGFFTDSKEQGYEDAGWDMALALDVKPMVENHQSRYISYLRAGTTYYLSDDGMNEGSALAFDIRKVEDLFFFGPKEEYMTGIKGGTLNCETIMNSTVEVTDLRFSWSQNGVRELEGYTGSTAKIKFNDLLDTSGMLPDHGMISIPKGDLGSTYVTCLVQFKYKNEHYYMYCDFYISGYSSKLESQVKVTQNTDGYGVNYHECFDFEEPLCEVQATAPANSQISYQWYKVDSLNPDIKEVYENESLYKKLSGYTSNEIRMSENLLEKLGEPSFVVDENNKAHLYTHIVCVVTVKNGTSTIKRKVPFEMEYMVQVLPEFDYEIITDKPGDVLSMPKAAASYWSAGRFTVLEKPDYLKYRFTWYDCTIAPPGTFCDLWGFDESIFKKEAFSKGLVKLGNGQNYTLDTSKLTVFEEETGKVSYVAVKVQPIYDGKKITCDTFSQGIVVFKIYYSSLKINSQPNDYLGEVGNYATFSIGATGDGLKYQWQYLNSNYDWINSNATGSTTSEMSIKITEARNGQKYRCIVTDKNGVKKESNVVQIIVGQKLEIISEPSDFTGLVGDPAYFQIEAKGEGLKFRWYYNRDGEWKKSSLNGYNTKTLFLDVTEARDGQQYRCVVTDKFGNEVTSAPATLHVGKPLTVVSQPMDYTAPVGSKAQFDFYVTGDGVSFQWYYKRDGVWRKSTATGADDSVMEVKITEARDGQQYKCVATDIYGNKVTSDVVTIRVGSPFWIDSQPSDFVGPVGSTAKFTVDAEGDDLKYQWYYLSDGVWRKSSANGSTTATMSIKVTEARNGQQYKCTVSDSHGTVRDTDIVTIMVGTAIKITSYPTDYYGDVGSTATFTVEAEGDDLKYQWYYCNDGMNWKPSTASGATSKTLKIKATEARDGQWYQCIIEDSHGQFAYTTIVELHVNKALEITSQPENVTGEIGQTAVFSVSATGTTPSVTYQW